jgi:Arc/MetJ-type ribon-helix-helix transcriptional regulator
LVASWWGKLIARPEQEAAIARAIESGAYENPEQVIERALELLRFEELFQEGKDGVAEKIERAFGQFERGEWARLRSRAPIWSDARRHGG